MVIELREINMKNFRECIKLEVDDNQKKFVASNMYSLAEARADNVSEPRAIYAGETMVGFIMYDYDSAMGTGWISRLMIEKEHQGKGYGRKAMEIVIARLKAQDGCKLLQTSFEPHNIVAKNLYISLGFHLTGEQVDGEDVCIMKVGNDNSHGLTAQGGFQVSRRMEKSIVRKIHMDYLLYLPIDFTYGKKWPLLLFLHGAGERGDDLEKVKTHGPPKLIGGGKQFPFILVSPQCPSFLWWTDKKLELKKIIDDVTGFYPVDMSRIYITGLSMGGFGTFEMLKEYPELFAAAVPICGGFKDTKGIEKTKHVPFWIFHGGEDKVVPVDLSRKAAKAIKESGGNAILTIYPKAGHDSWTETYNNEEVYAWIMAQRKADEI